MTNPISVMRCGAFVSCTEHRVRLEEKQNSERTNLSLKKSILWKGEFHSPISQGWRGQRKLNFTSPRRSTSTQRLASDGLANGANRPADAAMVVINEITRLYLTRPR